MAKRKYKTDLVNSRLYRIWAAMKNRCITTKGAGYRNYASRGITVCDEWKNDFLTFYNWAIKLKDELFEQCSLKELMGD